LTKGFFTVTLLALVLGASLLISPAVAQTSNGQVRGTTEHFDWTTPESLVARTRPLTNLVEEDLAEITEWLGLPDPPRGELIWVKDRDQLDELLGFDSPSWFAAVTQAGRNRIIMVVEVAQSQTQLRTTLRHELVHWAMQGMGAEALVRLPAWFHEGVAEAWVDQHLLGSMGTPLGWRAFRNELPLLYEYNNGFGQEPLHASEGYAMAYAFIDRLTRIHGEQIIAEMMAALQSGKSVDAALIQITGFGLIDHEQEMRKELGSLNRLLADTYPKFFLIMTLILLIGFPFAMRRRRRRWKRREARWLAEELENEEELDVDGQTQDDGRRPTF
jgi:hypothetical protein